MASPRTDRWQAAVKQAGKRQYISDLAPVARDVVSARSELGRCVYRSCAGVTLVLDGAWLLSDITSSKLTSADSTFILFP
jgi:hypothetical protein